MSRIVPICVQKLHPDENAHSALQKSLSKGGALQAVIQESLVWKKGDTINISFENDAVQQLCGGLVQWYSLDAIKDSLTADQLQIENDARAQPTFVAAVKLIVTKLVAPAVPSLTLNFVDSGGDVRVRFDSTKGSYSVVGTNCKQDQINPTMNLGWMDVGTIVHEFSHVLGMLHEHQNPNDPIKWDAQKVYAWAAATQGWNTEQTNENILNTFSLDSVDASTFDPNSVMLYFFPSYLTTNGYSPKQNLRYSTVDLAWLSKYYGNSTQQQSSSLVIPQQHVAAINVSQNDLFRDLACEAISTPLNIAITAGIFIVVLALFFFIGEKIVLKIFKNRRKSKTGGGLLNDSQAQRPLRDV
jgi:hypothetical protein